MPLKSLAKIWGIGGKEERVNDEQCSIAQETLGWRTTDGIPYPEE